MLLSTLQSKIDSISINPNDYATSGEYRKMITHRNALIEKYNTENKTDDKKQYQIIPIEYGKKWSEIILDYENKKLTQNQIDQVKEIIEPIRDKHQVIEYKSIREIFGEEFFNFYIKSQAKQI